MDLESECAVLVSAEDNEVTQERMPHDDDNEVKSNGSCPNENDKLVSAENFGVNTLVVDTNGEDVESAEPENSPPLDAKSPGGGSPGRTKGYGLKKWRRIKRDFVRDASASIDTSKILKRNLPVTGNAAKAQHSPLEIKQISEGSVGSAHVLTALGVADGFSIRGSSSDSRMAVGSAFAAGTDSENSEDRSSRSSTAASAPKVRYDPPAGREKTRMKNISGKNSGNSVQRGLQGKSRTEGSKKPRGERVKIEMENSHSSLESDSRSSNFLFVPGAFTVTSNGKEAGSSMNYDGENSDEAHTSEPQFSEEVQPGYGKENVGEVKDLSRDDFATDLAWDVKEEKSENHQPSKDRDPLVQSIFSLQFVQDALKKEVQKLKEIGKEPTSLHDSPTNGSGIPADFTASDPGKYIPSSSDELGSETNRQTALTSLSSQVLLLTKKLKYWESKLEEMSVMLEEKDSRIAELETTLNSRKSPEEESGSSIWLQKDLCREGESELEETLKQKIEAEIEYLVITRTIQRIKVAAVDLLAPLEEQNARNREQQAQVLNKLGEVESKSTMLKKQAEELEKYYEDIGGTEEVLKMQRRVFKASSFVFLQSILLVLVLWLFVLQSSPASGPAVPT